MSEPIGVGQVVKWFMVGLGSLLVVIMLCVGGCAGIKAFGRAQARSDAHNQVSITQIGIQKAQQQAKIVNAQIAATIAAAKQRYQSAVGVRNAQDEISKTLTPLYVQWEAIQAELAIAKSGRNNTIVYVPSGAQGIPLVTQAAHP